MKYDDGLSDKVFNFSVTTTKLLSQLGKNKITDTIISKISEKALEVWELFNNLKKTQEYDIQIYKINSIINKLDLYCSDLRILIASTLNTEVQKSLLGLIREAEDLNQDFSKILEEIQQERALEEKKLREKRFPYLGCFSFLIFVISLVFFIKTDSDLFIYLIFVSIVGVFIQVMKTFSSK